MRSMTRQRIAHFIVLAALVLAALPARAQSPPIKVLYPFAAGGSGDAIARIVADRLQAGLGVPVIIENRTGAAGRIAAKAVAAAEPDGRTLLMVPNPLVAIYPHSYPSLDYDPVKDFAPVALTATFDVALVAGPGTPATSLATLIPWLRANPDKAAYGSPGAGGLGHFVAVMLAANAKLEMRHVTYRGSAAVMSDLIGGQVPIGAVPLGDVAELHRAGKVRILAIAGEQRTSVLPDVPTFREQGIDLVGQGWYALYAPAKTPADVIARMSKIWTDAVAAPDLRARILALQLEPRASTPAELAAFQAADSARWAPAVKASGFKPEQ
jgi:tripartite-type tricarboxylate transporter receptor subunit TctC